MNATQQNQMSLIENETSKFGSVHSLNVTRPHTLSLGISE